VPLESLALCGTQRSAQDAQNAVSAVFFSLLARARVFDVAQITHRCIPASTKRACHRGALVRGAASCSLAVKLSTRPCQN
jgi:hypothetical protein